eukprot:TRINITY_DN1702_c1_g1_i1.p1 TRINITY_DN1702_c1_g1~~TRINITY_DN1702_c1_g1_i1.p1  ORF type:complete len:405 (+),score=69.32 TRINITY_DN1702_c1_g1_i1:79-1293(+)
MSLGGSSGLFEPPPTDTTDEDGWGSSSHTVTAATSSDAPEQQESTNLRVPTDGRLASSYDMERTTAVDPMIALERNMRLYNDFHQEHSLPLPDDSINQDEQDCQEEQNQVTLSVSNLTGHDLKPMTYIAFGGTVGLGVYVDGKRIGTSTRLIFNSETKVLRDQNGMGGCLNSDSTDDDIQKLAFLADLAKVKHNLDCTVAWGSTTEAVPVQRCRMTYKSAFDRLHMDGMFVKKEQQSKREAVKKAAQTAEKYLSQMPQRRVRVKSLKMAQMETIFKEAKVSMTKGKRKRILATDSNPCKTGFIIPEEDITGSFDISDDGFNESDDSELDNTINSPHLFIRFLDGSSHERWPRAAVTLLSVKPRNTNFSVIQKKTFSSELKCRDRSESSGHSRVFVINGTSPPRR